MSDEPREDGAGLRSKLTLGYRCSLGGLDIRGAGAEGGSEYLYLMMPPLCPLLCALGGGVGGSDLTGLPERGRG